MNKTHEFARSMALSIIDELSAAQIIAWANAKDDQDYPFLKGLKDDTDFWTELCEHDGIPIYDRNYAKQLFNAEFCYQKKDILGAATLGSFNGFYDLCQELIAKKDYFPILNYCDVMPKQHGMVGCFLCLNVLKKAVSDDNDQNNVQLFCQKGLILLNVMERLKNDQASIVYINKLGWRESFNSQCQPLDPFIVRFKRFFQEKLDELALDLPGLGL
jgi:hypothetical protein